MSDLGSPERQRRADAERSIAVILDAALELFAERPEASMAEVAAAAGVARQTVYAHFSSREALIVAAADRALAETLSAIDAAEPSRGKPSDALGRLIAAWWGSVARHARVLDVLASAYPTAAAVHDLHAPVLERLEDLIARGQEADEFDPNLPQGWLAAAFLGLMHVSADEVAAGRIDPPAAGRALAIGIPRLFAGAPRPGPESVQQQS